MLSHSRMGGIRMTDRTLRALTFGLLASTALVSSSMAQIGPADTADAPPATGQSPAPGTNATDVTCRPRGPAGAGRAGTRSDRDHHHRDQARRESPERADQRPGARHRASSIS